MKRLTNRLVIISLDNLSTLDFDYFSTLPNFKSFLNNASFSRRVNTIYPSLTYPAHASIVTGRYPKNHGIINNTLLQPERTSPDWYWDRQYINGETFYDLAIKDGMKVAALLWPTTGKSKIQYNMPEIFANRPWQNQVMVSLTHGSPLYQMVLNKRFGHLRKGKAQPHLDDFVHQSLLYTLEKHRPDITMVHYTDLDTNRHLHGFSSSEAMKAIKRHDSRLGEIVRTLKDLGIYEETTIIILGDHSSIDEDKSVNLNILLKENGLLSIGVSDYIKDYKAVVKTCDGSAYVYIKDQRDLDLVNKLHDLFLEFNKKYNCIEAIISKDEAAKMGADPNCTFMLEAKRGFYFQDNVSGELIKQLTPGQTYKTSGLYRSTHGYSPLKENYTTVFMASGKGIRSGVEIDTMNLIDEGPTLARLLGYELKEADGRVVEELLEIE